MDKRKTGELFNRIAASYDFLNRLLSFGIDTYWRRRLARAMPSRPKLNLLDLGTGTGDIIFSLWKKQGEKFKHFIGLDPAKEMLTIASQKTPKNCPVIWQLGDAQALTYPEATFDVVTMAFAIRNVPDPDQVLSEIYRVLSPNGRALILEFSIPQSWLIRSMYLFYFRKVLPLVGGMISKDKAAYRYLNESVEAFPYGQAFAEKLKHAGFNQVQFWPLTGGIATLYCGDKS